MWIKFCFTLFSAKWQLFLQGKFRFCIKISSKLKWERWQHIVAPDNHPEVVPYFDYVPMTIQRGRRRQDRYDPKGYQYYRSYLDLPDGNTHLIVCVRFRWSTQRDGTLTEEKFVTTAYLQSF